VSAHGLRNTSTCCNSAGVTVGFLEMLAGEAPCRLVPVLVWLCSANRLSRKSDVCACSPFLDRHWLRSLFPTSSSPPMVEAAAWSVQSLSTAADSYLLINARAVVCLTASVRPAVVVALRYRVYRVRFLPVPSIQHRRPSRRSSSAEPLQYPYVDRANYGI
jgi:hypothetical protein